MTVPTVSGDIRMKNRHHGVNFDDRDIPNKDLPKEKVETQQQQNLEGMVKTL